MLNIKKIQDIMRNDSGVNGDAQRLEQIAWILFLKLYAYYEDEWKAQSEMDELEYHSIIPENLRWENWAVGQKSLTGDALLEFINNELFPTLKSIPTDKDTPLHKSIIKKVFLDLNNYMKDGILLRQVINEVEQSLVINNRKDFKELCNIYEGFLKTLQSAGNAGEFYTPRAVTDFIVEVLDPKLGESVADLACGTGGFLVSAFHHLEAQVKSVKDRESLEQSFYGCEKKSLPFLLCATNLLINCVENPNLTHNNAFDFTSFDELDSEKKFDLIIMNPPYGGNEKKEDIQRFPKEFQSSETADLFMALIMQRLSNNNKKLGRAAVVMPDGFLFGNDTAKINLKKQLLNEHDLYLIVRLPGGVFAPYTSIATNLLFFKKDERGTKHTKIYRLDMPENIKSFSKTKPMKLEHFNPVREWLQNPMPLEEEKGFKANIFTKQQLEERGYNLDLCGFISDEEEILEPFALMESIKAEREALNKTLDSLMSEISALIKQG